jgi:hypothetical protein
VRQESLSSFWLPHHNCALPACVTFFALGMCNMSEPAFKIPPSSTLQRLVRCDRDLTSGCHHFPSEDHPGCPMLPLSTLVLKQGRFYLTFFELMVQQIRSNFVLTLA